MALSSSLYFYSRFIEPRRLTVQEIPIISGKIPLAFNHFKIVQFSDTHLCSFYEIGRLEELASQINQLKPDIVVFTGDLIDNPFTYRKADEIPSILKNIRAPFGKYAIYGNHDHGGNGTFLYRILMEHSGFRLLINNTVKIKKENEHIGIAGIDDVVFNRHHLEQALGHLSPRHFNILLAHEPDIAELASRYPVDLQISGHSHGGQIKLPFFGAVVTPKFGRKYVEGLYKVGNSDMVVYVNRGIGMTRMPLRFLSSPELTVFTLKSE
ncbi:metallophosphoesterase [Pueribacillus theae]|uniref:metallophosphoesterase n=1 Tax=Pueribacillus theae TaxID=2171751 RepID=UPI001F0B7212|nr:metallophosphoesterase [Pueribacillus theae]